MHSSPDPLDPLLDRWGNPPEPPSHLSAEVWRRVALAESRGERPGLVARVEAVFSRPSFAVAFVAACMLLGLFLAQVRLSRIEAARSAQLAQSYLQLIDPLIEQSPAVLAAHTP